MVVVWSQSVNVLYIAGDLGHIPHNVNLASEMDRSWKSTRGIGQLLKGKPQKPPTNVQVLTAD